MKCYACNHHHSETEPHECTLLNCKCDHEKFVAYAGTKSFNFYVKVIASFDTAYEKVEYLIKEVPGFKNLTNKQFVFAYWHYVFGFCPGMVLDIVTYKNLTDPETVTRCKRKVMENNPSIIVNDQLQAKKNTKQVAIMEWVTQ